MIERLSNTNRNPLNDTQKMKLLETSKPVPPVEFSMTMQGFLYNYVINLFTTRFFEEYKSIRLFTGTDSYFRPVRTKSTKIQQQGEKNSGKKIEFLLKAAIEKHTYFVNDENFIALESLENLFPKIPFLKDLKTTLRNAESQIQKAIENQDFDWAFAFYEYYTKNVKQKFEVRIEIEDALFLSGKEVPYNGHAYELIETGLLKLFASIHSSAADFIETSEDEGEPRNYDATFHRIEAAVALQQALTLKIFKNSFQPQEIYELLLKNLNAIDDTLLWPEHTRIASELAHQLANKMDIEERT